MVGSEIHAQSRPLRVAHGPVMEMFFAIRGQVQFADDASIFFAAPGDSFAVASPGWDHVEIEQLTEVLVITVDPLAFVHRTTVVAVNDGTGGLKDDCVA